MHNHKEVRKLSLFGALLANREAFRQGLRTSLLIAAFIAIAAAWACQSLNRAGQAGESVR